MTDMRQVAVWAALVAYNVPILVTAIQALRTTNYGRDLGGALKEKDSTTGDPSEAMSFSRFTGAVGAVMVASLFWVVSNIAIGAAILQPASLAPILGGAGKLFLVGAALFLPYVFNQLKSVLQ